MISVIVPVYNVEPYLHQCLDSICHQTYRDLEIILVDDGSPDRCGEICDDFARNDGRIRVLHTENRGLSAARNLGLWEARGEYICFVDSDDWIEADMYELLLNSLKKTGADISLCGHFMDFHEERKTISRKIVFEESLYSGDQILKALLEEKINNVVWNKLYCRELLEGTQFPEGKNYEDIAIMHKICDRAEKMTVIQECMYHYRIRPDSIVRDYAATNQLDYADAHLERYYFFRDKASELFLEKKDKIVFCAANGISKVWRWWHGCTSEEKKKYHGRIVELQSFTKEHIPLFGYRSWPLYMRVSAFFMHSRSKVSFAILYSLNQFYRRLRPEKGNIV